METYPDILECMMAEEIKCTTIKDGHIGELSTHVIHGWPSVRTEVIKEVKQYWSFKDEVVLINGTAWKGRRIVIPSSLQKRALDQLHVNHTGIEETGLLTCGFIYWIKNNNRFRKCH